MIRIWLSLAAAFLCPGLALAGDDHAAALVLPWWMVLPFALLLLSIAVLPLVAGHWWHKNRNKAIVAALFAIPAALLLVAWGPATEWRSTTALVHEMLEGYVPFIILLGALYTVSGGIALQGDLEGRPATNTLLLGLGAVLANLMGTTGASMLLIRAFLRINSQRKHVAHLPVFFIFIVSNVGGLLTPLGDPPLFLGFKRGVDFTWTLSLWPQWLLVNGALLAIFFVWDTLAHRREERRTVQLDKEQIQPLRVFGLHNLIFMAGIVVAVLFQSPQVGRAAGAPLGLDLTLHWPWGELAMVVMASLAYVSTKASIREANGFDWTAIAEVAILFFGIFVTMVPALALLSQLSGVVTEPWQFFWMTGALSSFLDNAPTYLAFAAMASGDPHNLRPLMEGDNAAILAAISCGAVFMGANTYIGNGPNFMVKAIADGAGFKTPSFLGYMLYSGLILLPIFAVVTVVFFIRW